MRSCLKILPNQERRSKNFTVNFGFKKLHTVMDPLPRQKSIKKKLVTAKTIFIVTIFVIALTVVGIWLLGLGEHRTLFKNSILSTSILSGAFFLFLTVGLYRGVKLKNDFGNVNDHIHAVPMPNISFDSVELPSDLPDAGEGVAGVILGVIAWILVSVVLLLLIWVFGAVLWMMILLFAAMLYWIFFRALRLVFKKSRRCKGNPAASLAYGIGYTILYSFWIYGIILAAHYLIK